MNGRRRLHKKVCSDNSFVPTGPREAGTGEVRQPQRLLKQVVQLLDGFKSGQRGEEDGRQIVVDHLALPRQVTSPIGYRKELPKLVDTFCCPTIQFDGPFDDKFQVGRLTVQRTRTSTVVRPRTLVEVEEVYSVSIWTHSDRCPLPSVDNVTPHEISLLRSYKSSPISGQFRCYTTVKTTAGSL